MELLPNDVGQLPCSTCEMLANVDPDFHEERYAHAPKVRVAGNEYVWDSKLQTFALLSTVEVDTGIFAGGRVSDSVDHVS